MLRDGYRRKVDYLRISVTDRCNLRCIYCLPERGAVLKPAEDILTFEEIAWVAGLATRIGINKIKITGGEPLVRRGLPKLIELLSSIAGVTDISMTTNGVLLRENIKQLRDAGLKRVNVSIDTFKPEKFRFITRFGNLEDVLSGIDAALAENILVKLNAVIVKGINDDEILRFIGFAQKKRIVVRFIELMPSMNNSVLIQNYYISCDEIKSKIEVLGGLKAIESENLGSGPARYYTVEGSPTIVGFISPLSDKFCDSCNRVRLTADGFLMPCLSSQVRLDIKSYLRENREREALDTLKKAVFLKPEGHEMTFSSRIPCSMSQIGG